MVILELNTVTEISFKLQNELSNKMGMTEEIRSELEHRSIEIIQSKKQRKHEKSNE